MKPDYQALKGEYEEKGFVRVPNFFPASTIAQFKAHFDEVSRRNDDTPPEDWNFWLFDEDRVWFNLISNPTLLDLAECFVGEDIVHLGSHYWAKPPRKGRKVLWHQDGSYYDIQPMNLITVWISIDRSSSRNGCVRVIPGSHRQPFLPMNPTIDYPLLKRVMDSGSVDESLALDLELEPGDISIHHPNLIHGSRENLSDEWRRGLAIRYLSAASVIGGDKVWPWAYLLRGRDHSNGNVYQTPLI